MPGTSFGWRVTLSAVSGFCSATLVDPWHAPTNSSATHRSARGTASGVDLREHDRRHPQMGHARIAPDGLLGHLERVLEGGRALETEPVHYIPIRADED